MAARGQQFTLVLVGDGPQRNDLMQLAEDAGIRNFHLLGNQPQAALNQLYRRADVFVFPTLEDVWGLVVNEALWAGCPVLCSSYAGCAAEIVPPGNVFDPMSPASFDLALQKAISGNLEGADTSVLRTCREVGAMVTSALVAEPSPYPALSLVADPPP